MEKRKKILREEIGYFRTDLEFPADILRELFRGNVLVIFCLPMAMAISLVSGLGALGRIIIG